MSNPEEERFPEWSLPSRIQFELDDGSLIYASPDNSIAFMHPEDQKQYDHIFIFKDLPAEEWENAEEDDIIEGAFVWRARCENFDAIIAYMLRHGFSVTEPSDATTGDIDAYNRQFGVQDMKPEEVKEPPAVELTPRQERLIAFLAYTLEHEHLAVEDFMQHPEGDMFI